MFSEAKPRATLRSRSFNKIVISPQLKSSKNCERIVCLAQAKNLPRFQGARPNHVRVESSSC